MAWVALSWSAGNILTSSDMAQLQANILAVAADATGAPTIASAAIQDASVEGDKINRTSISESSYSLPTSSTWTPTAGWYEMIATTGNLIGYEPFTYAGWVYSISSVNGFLFFDGSSFRIEHLVGISAETIYYRTLGT